MKLIIFLMIVVLGKNVNAAGKSNKNPLNEQVKSIAELEWQQSIEPGLSLVNDKSPGTIWKSRLTVPFPAEWPLKDDNLIFYAYARGINIQNLRDGEYVGRVWAKVTSSPKPKLILQTKKLLTTKEVVSVRPLNSHEIDILNTDPTGLILSKRSTENDKKIKEIYCLQKSIGNIPSEIIDKHVSFFSWLSCR